jgi:hypothetical protein
MNEYGLILKQEVISVVNTRQDYNTKQGATAEMHSHVTMKFTWIDCETGEKDENLFAANGQNGWDKGMGSALTYGERYFLLKFFHIATDEDDIDNLDRTNKQPTSVKQPEQSKQATEQIKTNPNKSQPLRTETPSEFENQEQQNQEVPTITTKQKEIIIRLLNHVLITRQEKTKTLLNINRLSTERAVQMIDNLEKVIAQRTEEEKQVQTV